MTTERQMLNLLHKRFGRLVRNGMIENPRYVCAEHVRNEPAFAGAIADFVAVDTWDSGNHAVHGFEVKTSRADWLAELRAPEKSAWWRSHVDYWWLVVADKDIVRGDLPPGWGLLTATKSLVGLREAMPAERNHAPLVLEPKALASLLRAAANTAAGRGHRSDRPGAAEALPGPPVAGYGTVGGTTWTTAVGHSPLAELRQAVAMLEAAEVAAS